MLLRALTRLLLLAALLLSALWAVGCAEAARERLQLGLAPPISVAVIVHGAEGDPFWRDVQDGAADAARAFDVNLFWRSTPNADERVRLINEAIQQGFDVLVVSLSDPDALSKVVADAALIGLSVYVINVGSELVTELGATSYFGQVETVAGLAVGDRLLDQGASHLLCVRHERRNVALATRCERAGSRLERVTTLAIDPADPRVTEIIEAALIADQSIDAVLTMTTSVMTATTEGIAQARAQSPSDRTIVHAVFEISAEVLTAIEEGRVAFAVDQQPYLQGYLPVAYARLEQYAQVSQRYEQGDELADAMLQWIAGSGILLGPGFVDSANVHLVRASAARPSDEAQ